MIRNFGDGYVTSGFVAPCNNGFKFLLAGMLNYYVCLAVHEKNKVECNLMLTLAVVCKICQ